MTTPPRTHLPRLSLGQWRTVAGCAWRVFKDSERTGDIVIAEEITAQRQLAFLRQRDWWSHGEGLDVWNERPNLAEVDMQALRELPADTLGGALTRFYEAHDLPGGVYDVPADYTDDPDLAYLIRRIRHSHDIWHVLMNFGTAGHEEILVHAFSLAQTGLPASIALMALGSLKHMVFEGRVACLTEGLAVAYRRGRAAEPLIPVYWERHWETSVDDLRARLNIQPWTDRDHAASEPGVLRFAAAA